MSNALDLRDIQGNVVRAYSRFGFPHARYFLFHIAEAKDGRAFLADLHPWVTTSERWRHAWEPDNSALPTPPQVTLNVALTWKGLRALDLPTETLSQFPREFIDGMAPRNHILTDIGPSGHHHWDPVWRAPIQNKRGTDIHVLITLNAQMMPDGTPVPDLEKMTDWLRELGGRQGIKLLTGHGPAGRADFQQGGARLVPRGDGTMMIDAQEHFGFEDGIGNPVFSGQYPKEVEARRVKGRGKIMPDQSWAPLAAGEFLIGHVDESQQIPYATQPPNFMFNGTFLAFRKLHENVGTFHKYVERQATDYARVQGVTEHEARLTLKAKIVGRWTNGVPLMAAPTYADMMRFDAEWSDIPVIRNKSGQRTGAEQARLDAWNALMIDFKYRDDQVGTRCPISAHIRRGNMRDMLDPRMTSSNPKDWTGSALTNRRRILRRGLPYGAFDPDNHDDTAERGVIFIAMCANIFRQFEFVLQQWMNYGLDLRAGNDTCPLLGFHPPQSKFMVPSDPDHDGTPWIMNELPQFVETRGGEYFFVPSLNTLNMIALGVVDPT